PAARAAASRPRLARGQDQIGVLVELEVRRPIGRGLDAGEPRVPPARGLLIAHELDDGFDSSDAHGCRAYRSVAPLTSTRWAAPWSTQRQEHPSETSIEGQGGAILIVGHVREVVSGIHVSRPREEELLEGLAGAATQ